MVRVPSDNLGNFLFGNDHSCTFVWCCCFWHRLYSLLLWSFSAFANDRHTVSQYYPYMLLFFSFFFHCFCVLEGPMGIQEKPGSNRGIESKAERIVSLLIPFFAGTILIWLCEWWLWAIQQKAHTCAGISFLQYYESQKTRTYPKKIRTISYYVLAGPE